MKFVKGMGVVAQDGRVLGQYQLQDVIGMPAERVLAVLNENVSLRRQLRDEQERLEWFGEQFTHLSDLPSLSKQRVTYMVYDEEPFGLPGDTLREAIDRERAK